MTLTFDYAMSFECSDQLGYVEELGALVVTKEPVPLPAVSPL